MLIDRFNAQLRIPLLFLYYFVVGVITFITNRKCALYCIYSVRLSHDKHNKIINWPFTVINDPEWQLGTDHWHFMNTRYTQGRSTANIFKHINSLKIRRYMCVYQFSFFTDNNVFTPSMATRGVICRHERVHAWQSSVEWRHVTGRGRQTGDTMPSVYSGEPFSGVLHDVLWFPSWDGTGRDSWYWSRDAKEHYKVIQTSTLRK